jgi:hypothetical protein
MLLFALISSSCQNINNTDRFGCISNNISFGFPVRLEQPLPDYHPIYPEGGGWVHIADIPDTFSGFTNSILPLEDDSLLFATKQGVYKYHVQLKTWDKISDKNLGSLIHAKNGSIWGVNNLINEIILSKFDSTLNDFVDIQDNDGYLKTVQSNSGGGTKLIEDENGYFWMNVYNGTSDSLISYDPVSNSIGNIVLSDDRLLLGDFVIRDNVIWVIEWEKDKLMTYDIKHNKLSDFTYYSIYPDDFINENLLDMSTLFVDRKGNLWIDERGWFYFDNDENPSWYKIIRSSVFIDEGNSTENYFRWVRPISIYESTNGQLWFRSAVGLARVDPLKGDWCRFTNIDSPIIEDENQSIWIVLYGKVYKYNQSK